MQIRHSTTCWSGVYQAPCMKGSGCTGSDICQQNRFPDLPRSHNELGLTFIIIAPKHPKIFTIQKRQSNL